MNEPNESKSNIRRLKLIFNERIFISIFSTTDKNILTKIFHELERSEKSENPRLEDKSLEEFQFVFSLVFTSINDNDSSFRFSGQSSVQKRSFLHIPKINNFSTFVLFSHRNFREIVFPFRFEDSTIHLEEKTSKFVRKSKIRFSHFFFYPNEINRFGFFAFVYL